MSAKAKRVGEGSPKKDQLDLCVALPGDLPTHDPQEEVAGYEGRLAAIDNRLSVLTWIASTNVALTIVVLFKLFH